MSITTEVEAQAYTVVVGVNGTDDLAVDYSSKLFRPARVKITYEYEPAYKSWDCCGVVISGSLIKTNGSLSRNSGKREYFRFHAIRNELPDWVQEIVTTQRPMIK